MNSNDSQKRAVLNFCRGLFSTSNLIGSDFDDVELMKVVGRNFPQQIGGEGLLIMFSVSWHAVAKTGKKAHDALGILLPNADED